MNSLGCIAFLLFIIAAVLFPPLWIVGLVWLGVWSVKTALQSGKQKNPIVQYAAPSASPRPPARRQSRGTDASWYATYNEGTPRPVLEAENARLNRELVEQRQRVIQEAGREFTALVNHALDGGLDKAAVRQFFGGHCGIKFTIENGKLNITEDELFRIAPDLVAIRQSFEYIDRQSSAE